MIALQDIQDAAQRAEAFVEQVWAEKERLERCEPQRPMSDERRRLLQQWQKAATKMQKDLEPLQQAMAKVQKQMQQDLKPLQQTIAKVQKQMQQDLKPLQQTIAKAAQLWRQPSVRARLKQLDQDADAIHERFAQLQPIASFLAKHPGLLEVLNDGIQHLHHAFPGNRGFTMTLEADREVSNWEYLVVRVKTNLSVEDAHKCMAAFDEEWLLDRSAAIGDTLLFDVEYA
jgi:exonuclease VII large subunit